MYSIFDEEEKLLFSCEDYIECHDFLNSGFKYLFALTGVSTDKVNTILSKGKMYTLKGKIEEFNKDFDFCFIVSEVMKFNNTWYIYANILLDMYKVGAISLLRSQNSNDNERIWLDMIKESKIIYISASYLINGVKKENKKETVVIEGKYIHDYYSFYCEFGYAFFGKFGYMGNNLDAFNECLIEIGRRNKTINVIWKDSELSFKAITNTVPEDLYKTIYHDMVMTLEEHCNLILE